MNFLKIKQSILLFLFSIIPLNASDMLDYYMQNILPAIVVNNSVSSSDSLLLIYLAGSDLEENGEYGTKDILEMIDGYNKLSKSQKDTIDIKVAFGGSKSNNWNGIKYADMSCLIEDSIDNTIGDDNCYSYDNTQSNMGEENTLYHFLNYYKDDTKKQNLILWNHGGAFDGICYDSNFDNDKLTISELKNVLSKNGSTFEIIGMDACSMANLEVSKGIKDYSKYLIASEELEPGHGWDYEDLVYNFGTIKDSVKFGKSVVDSFIDSSKHKNTENKTLSLIDLTKVDSVITSLDTLSVKVKNNYQFEKIASAAYNSRKYAKGVYYEEGKTIDLMDFNSKLKSNIPAVLSYSNDLEAKINNLIIYSRHELGESSSNGISIMQPLNSKSINNNDYIPYRASENWISLLVDLYLENYFDSTDPQILTETECNVNNKEGYCIEASDNLGIKMAESTGWLPYGNDLILLYSEKLSKSNNNYFMPKFSDEWLYLCNGDSNDQCIYPSAHETDPVRDNTRLYFSYGSHNDKLVKFFFEVDTNNNVSIWSTPKIDSEHGSKLQSKIKVGDKINFYFFILDTTYNTFRYDIGDTLTFSSTPTVKNKSFNADVTYGSLIYDFNNNITLSEFYQTSDTNDNTNNTDDSDIYQTEARLQYESLNKIAGKTIEFNYFYYSDLYTETIYLDDSPSYEANVYNDGIKATLTGKGPFNNDVICLSISNTGKLTGTYGALSDKEYYCTWYYSSGSQNSYLFDLSGSSITGYYDYSPSYKNGLAEVILNPDSTLRSSYMRSVNKTDTNISEKESEQQKMSIFNNIIIKDNTQNIPLKKKEYLESQNTLIEQKIKRTENNK